MPQRRDRAALRQPLHGRFFCGWQTNLDTTGATQLRYVNSLFDASLVELRPRPDPHGA